ncbi:ParB/RepB/Spo0J family partition protein [Streptomyces sp. H27-C3]|uniref:ParB/RepB/Spo0J family partition protein n=1 Tax=Streptomyces sp. H27-C3 TaxID=3046305 RepID=UPI0024BB54BD|nr:ParB/RepB/Spo0J family partition protein [Streptomyces sp. H27-C3]MDJ0466114.1 ParB/RepB/Spo0J family partition protein [Streptomyces sp. H27-C3]
MSNSPGLGDRDLGAERAAVRAKLGGQKLIPQGLPTARIDQLLPSPENGRKKLHKVEELARTLKSDGMNTAMTVLPPDIYLARYPQHTAAVQEAVARGVLYIVHHGHRRLAAAKLAGLQDVPVLVRTKVTSLRIAAIQENLQRMSLNPIEEGEEFRETLQEVDEETGKVYSQRALAERVGASQTYITHRVALLRLIPELREAVVNHWLKKQGVDPKTDGPLLPVRPAATVYARLRQELQKAFFDGSLPAEHAAIVANLRDELQGAFLEGKLSIEDAAGIAELPPSQQKLPDPLERPAPHPAKAVVKADPPAPAPEGEKTPVPTPRGETNPEPAPDTDGPDPDGNPGNPVPPAADTPNGEGEKKTAEVLVATPRVIEIREQKDLDQLVLSLIEHLTDEERDYVREQLA